MVKAREEGDAPINCLEDRSRRVLGRGDVGFNSAEEFLKQRLESLQDSWKGFTMPMWDDQPRNMLISLEKDALSRLVSRIANRYSVKTFPTRGYPSFSYVQDMSRYVSNKMGEKHTVILYFGDFDLDTADFDTLLNQQFRFFEVVFAIDLVERHGHDMLVGGDTSGQDFRNDSICNDWEAIVDGTSRSSIFQVIYFTKSQYKGKDAFLVIKQDFA